MAEVEGVIEWAGDTKGAAFGPVEWGDWDYIVKVILPINRAISKAINIVRHHACVGFNIGLYLIL